MPKRSAKDAAETRERIVDVARLLFAKQGFADTSTSEIAKAAGVTDGALFHHFKNKRDLFHVVVDKLQRQFHANVLDSAGTHTDRRQAFIAGARASLILSQAPEYQRVVLIEAPSVLGGGDWRKLDSKIALGAICPTLRGLANDPSIPDNLVNPFAMLVLGLLNETVFALSRYESGIEVDSIIDLLEQSIDDWLKRVKRKK